MQFNLLLYIGYRAKAVSSVCFAFGLDAKPLMLFLSVSASLYSSAVGLFSFHLVFEDLLWTGESICVQLIRWISSPSNCFSGKRIEIIYVTGVLVCLCVCDNSDRYLFWMTNHSPANMHATDSIWSNISKHQTVPGGNEKEGSFRCVSRWFEYHMQLRQDSALK